MNNPYALPSLVIATLRGRDQVFRKICQDLGEKTTPDHVSIVGPRYFGKTVLLKTIAEQFGQPGSRYQVVLYWDLRHDTPETDQAFMRALAKKLDACLIAQGITEFHEYLNDNVDELGGNISDVVDSLGADDKHILILLDDFDRLAGQPQITKNLWDYLRSLAQKDHLRFVTTSRRRLRESIPSRESRTSDFWNNFNNVVTLKTIEHQAFDAFVAPLLVAGWAFEESAKKEFFNWTGGVPVLVARLCRDLYDEGEASPVAKARIDSLCERIEGTDWLQDTLGTLWDDCSKELQGELLDLAGNPALAANINPLRQQALIERGYLVKDGNKAKVSCRLMFGYAAQHEVRQRDLRDLFKDPDSELRSLRALLELRLAEVEGGDPETRSFIEHAIDGLSKGQKTALAGIRSIAEEALSCAWKAECPNNIIPAEMQKQLTLSWDAGGGGLSPDLLAKVNDKNARRRMLRVAAGDQGLKKVTRKVSRPMMLLIDHLHGLGNYGQHMNDIPEDEEKPVDVSFCASACWSAIELLKRMSEDLK